MWTLAVAYLIGSFPTGYLVVKALTGEDIRRVGSGNVGGLNTYRTVSRKYGKALGLLAGGFVALVDASKAVIAYLLASSYTPALAPLAPFFAILGHNYPLWLGFRGGRGLASLFGIMLFLTPAALALFLLIQGAVYAATKRFALGAILALLTALPLYHLLTLSYPATIVLAELPVWMRYREKYELWRAGKLGVNM